MRERSQANHISVSFTMECLRWVFWGSLLSILMFLKEKFEFCLIMENGELLCKRFFFNIAYVALTYSVTEFYTKLHHSLKMLILNKLIVPCL